MRYISTRGNSEPVTFTTALLNGLASDGGLYIPEKLPPPASREQIRKLAHAPYTEVAASVCSVMVGDLFDDHTRTDCGGNGSGSRDTADADHAFTDSSLADSFKAAYANFSNNSNANDADEVVPLKEVTPDTYILEAFHGPTLSFKDIAMQLLGQWLPKALRQIDGRALVLGATSGDTGSAAVDAFANKPGVSLVILHPHNRVSQSQRLQMTTCTAANVHNLAVTGTFDDCQRIVKQLFAAQWLKKKVHVTGINSINFGRILAQMVYYVSTGCRLFAKHGTAPDFVVPTGNFGNAFAAYLAKQLGWPIGKIILATNSNDILVRTYGSAQMSVKAVKETLSPAMDIQISSNFERFLYLASGRADVETSKVMQEFLSKGNVALSEKIMNHFRTSFHAFSASDAEIVGAMQQAQERFGLVLDPHTAAGFHAMNQYRLVENARITDRNTGSGSGSGTGGGGGGGGGAENSPVVLVATAHPAKFPETVSTALGYSPDGINRLNHLQQLEERCTTVSPDLAEIEKVIARGLD